MVVTSASLYFLSWVTSHYKSAQFEWEAARLLICFYGSNFCILILSGIFVRIRVCDYTADRLAAMCDGMIGPWIRYTPLIAILHQLLYGGKVSVFTEINGFNYVAPSKSRYLKVGRGSSISSCYINIDKNRVTTIGNNCSIGILATLEPGVVIEDNSAVAAFANVPAGEVVKANTSFFTSSFQTRIRNEGEGKEHSVLEVLLPIVSKILGQITGTLFLVCSTVLIVNQVYIHFATGIALQAPILTALVLIIAGITFCLFDIVVQWVVVPNCSRTSDNRCRFSSGSIKAALYVNHLGTHHMVDSFSSAFLRGTIFMPLIHKAMGARIENTSQVLIMGNIYDSKNLDISKGERNDTESGIAGDFYFVSDIRSYFLSHRLEHGVMVFEKCETVGQVSLHPLAINMGQTLVDVTLGKQTRVLFSKTVTKSTSGFYYGMLSMECADSESDSMLTLNT